MQEFAKAEDLKIEEIKQDVERENIAIEVSNSDDAERKYDFWTIRSEQAFKEAKDDGCIVVLPRPNQLLIDIDSPEAEEVYNKNKATFEMHVATILNEERKTSRSGNTHTSTLRWLKTSQKRIASCTNCS